MGVADRSVRAEVAETKTFLCALALAALFPAAAHAATPPLQQLTAGSTTYPMSVATFSPQAFDLTSPALLAATDLCNATMQDFTGKIAVVNRGACAFTVKADTAQAAHALGLVVVDFLGRQRTADPGGHRRERRRSRWPA